MTFKSIKILWKKVFSNFSFAVLSVALPTPIFKFEIIHTEFSLSRCG